MIITKVLLVRSEKMKVSVSFLKRKESLTETIKKIEQTDCDYIHVDVTDGLFVPEKTGDIPKYLQNTSKKLDVHLMCAHPLEYINIYKNLNAEYITIQVEINEDKEKLLKIIKEANIKVGLALNPETPLTEILPYLPYVNQVLVMSVQPGLGGQPFQTPAIAKIKKLNQIRQENNYSFIINVDGGINEQTIKLLNNIGLDMCVSGSFVCLADDYQKQINKLR